MSRLVFLTCHLTGTGHLVRTMTLARKATAMGHQTSVITGGRPVGHVDLSGARVIQLPPIFVRRFEFSDLRDASGSPVTDDYMAQRKEILAQSLEALAPDALITELFPFGRRMLADEFLSAIVKAKQVNPNVAVISSIRDIPEPKPKRLTETATHLLKKYNGVLVHGDEQFLPLWTTWPLPDDVAPMVQHVGYVGGGQAMDPPRERSRSVLVSVGGGALGRRLLQVAAAASALTPSLKWHLLVGGADASETVATLRSEHPVPGLIVEPVRPDYRDLLRSAGCSVNLCGYNTAVELLSSQTPAILIPSEEADETEQAIRAKRLADLPGLSIFSMDSVTPEQLAREAEALCNGPERPLTPLPGDDGALAIRKIEELVADHSR